MSQELARHPVGNFFIKRALQVRLIYRITIAVLIATLVCACTLFLVYYFTYNSILLYIMDIKGNLTKETIVDILVPSLIISSLVNILMAIFVGLYASRKYAVPIYKIEQWVRHLLEGRISAQIQFREKEELRDLSHNCNMLTDQLQQKFTAIAAHLDALEAAQKQNKHIAAIAAILGSVDYKNDPIKIETAILKHVRPGEQKS
ncbi:MAG: hypothetical protein PHC61_06390 [Chitinivibrionales bacterium]|nr:hypothetical protein [Chitinivibrionales bacterium]